MDTQDIRIVATAEARRALTGGNIRDEIAFQNDINTLLARLEETQFPLLVEVDQGPDAYAAAALAIAVPSFSRKRK